MDLKLLEQLAAILGVAGLCVGAFFLLMRGIISRTDLFEQISAPNTFRFMRLVAILSFVVAIVGLLVYAFLRFFVPEAAANACIDLRSIITTNVTINCTTLLPLRQRQSNFLALANDLEAFENYSFPKLVNNVAQAAAAADKNRSESNREFWVSLGELFYKNASRLNRAYHDLAICFINGGCAITDDMKNTFCQSVLAHYKRIAQTNQIFGSLSVGINVQQPGAPALIPDHVVRLPGTENLESIATTQCRTA
jgi:hypothetical protein